MARALESTADEQLDRFMVRVFMGPRFDEERGLAVARYRNEATCDALMDLQRCRWWLALAALSVLRSMAALLVALSARVV